MTTRALTQEEEEKFSRAVANAVAAVSSFRDAIALLRPFFSDEIKTASTDQYSRIGVGKWFFALNPRQRASVVLHEVMHVLNNHFSRAEDLNVPMDIMNIAGDFEINCSLDQIPQVDLSFGIFPDDKEFNFQRNLMAEEYVHLLLNSNKNRKKQSESDSEQDSSSSGFPGMSKEIYNKIQKGERLSKEEQEEAFRNAKSSPCDAPSQKTSYEADKSGIERASYSEQTIAKKNTIIRVSEELKELHNSGRYGYDHLDSFLNFVIEIMKPAKVQWQTIFRTFLANSVDNIQKGMQNYSYKRSNRRFSNSDFFYPGMIKFVPKVLLGIDTSGSMGKEDFQAIFYEISGIISKVLKQHNQLKIFNIDTEITNIKSVSSVKDMDLSGGGGTDMSIAVKYAKSLKKQEKPDILIVSTDGETNWDSIEKELKDARFICIFLITIHNNIESISKRFLNNNKVSIIDIS